MYGGKFSHSLQLSEDANTNNKRKCNTLFMRCGQSETLYLMWQSEQNKIYFEIFS